MAVLCLLVPKSVLFISELGYYRNARHGINPNPGKVLSAALSSSISGAACLGSLYRRRIRSHVISTLSGKEYVGTRLIRAGV